MNNLYIIFDIKNNFLRSTVLMSKTFIKTLKTEAHRTVRKNEKDLLSRYLIIKLCTLIGIANLPQQAGPKYHHD
jgi:hypothetical protein